MTIDFLKSSKVPKIAMALFLFLLPWQTRWIYKYGEINGWASEYGTLSIYATEVLLLVVALLFMIKNPIPFYKMFKKRRGISLIFMLFLFFSLIWSGNKEVSLFFLLHLAASFILIAILWSIDKREDLLFYLYAFIGGVLIQAILGIVQVSMQWVSANTFLGIAKHDPSLSGTFVIETMGSRFLRAYGGLPHPNILGGYLAVGTLLVASAILREKEKANQIIFWITEIILSIALFLTFSRSAWLAAVVGFAAILFFNFSKIKNQVTFRSKFIVCASIFALVFIIFGFVFRDAFINRFSGEGRLENISREERISGFGQAAALIKENLFLGIGLGNYTLALATPPYQPVHNVPLLVLSEVGIVGFVILILFVIIFAKRINHTHLPIILGFFVISLLDHYLWSLYSGLILTGFVAGLSLNRMRGEAHEIDKNA